MSTGLAVEITSLVKRYGRVTAVNGLSLRAGRAAVTAILGPNGAGKTTTIEICEGYRRPDDGVVRVLGLDPDRDARQLRPQVGVMLQSGGIPPAARPGEYLRVVAAFYAHPLDPAMLLDRLGLSGSLRTPFRRMSGGQQQRLALAAAVIGRPELVFLDEPTAGLDPQARLATWELISGLRAAGAAVILTTHNMDEAQRLADQVAVVDHGQLVAEGTPGRPDRHRRAAAVPGRAGAGHRRADRRPAAGQRGQGVPGRPLHRGGARPGGPATPRRGDRLVRRARRAGPGPAHREPHPGGRVPRADRTGAALVSEAVSASPGGRPPEPPIAAPRRAAAQPPRSARSDRLPAALLHGRPRIPAVRRGPG